MYRGFIKPITALGGLPYGSADLRITEMTIKRDILTKASSTFTVLDIPDEAEVGNVFGCYDNAGKVVYVGVITNIDDKTIQTDQIISIFNDNWKYRDPNVSTIEGKIKDIIDGFGTDSDTLLARIFSQFTTTALTSTTLDLPTQNENYVTNFMDFLFKVYESYQILVDINVSIGQNNPTINIGVPSYTPLLLSDNNNVLRNFNVIKETYETNKLVLYSSDGQYRGTWYGTPNGITTNSAADRLPKIRTNIVFSNDDYNTIVADNLSQEMYNHKIELELVLNNKLYDFESFHLGQSFNIFYEKKTYASILTGYELKVNQNGASDVVKLVFGIVRVSLVDKLNKLVRGQQNLNSEQIRSEITSANVTNALGYTPYDASNPNNYTSNAGTITGIRMNGASKGSSGVVDLGTVLTSLDMIYPVGAIYMSTVSTSPATLFGGTWERIQDTFLLCAGSSYSAGSTGGAASTTLTAANLPHQTGSLLYHGYASGTNMQSGDGVFSGSSTVTGYKLPTDAHTSSSSISQIKYDNGGSSTSFTNMPPYLAVYVWKRTA